MKGEYKSIVAQSLQALYDLGNATSVEIAEKIGVSRKRVSSALSRVYKFVPNLITRNTDRRPYIWQIDCRDISWKEVYKRYLESRTEFIQTGSIQHTGENAVRTSLESFNNVFKIVIKVDGSIDVNLKLPKEF